MLDLLEARTALLTLARPSVAYCREHGIDWVATATVCGGLYMAPIRPDPPRFDFDPDGVEAAICEARAEDGVTVVDLVAWPASDPGMVLTALGTAVALGEAAASDPSTYFGGAPLRLFRTPLAWLQAGCKGAVLLHSRRGARWLMDVPTTVIEGEDSRHARALSQARAAVTGRQRFVARAVSKPEPVRWVAQLDVQDEVEGARASRASTVR